LWKAAGDAGMLCVTLPEKYGGLGLDIRYAAVGWEEQSYSNCTGPGFFLHNEISSPYVYHYGTEEQKMHYLPKFAKGTKFCAVESRSLFWLLSIDNCIGELISAIAMTEPGIDDISFASWFTVLMAKLLFCRRW
jgi:alkylation response protein AidB-like acyl-CoA dehydrogenase